MVWPGPVAILTMKENRRQWRLKKNPNATAKAGKSAFSGTLARGTSAMKLLFKQFFITFGSGSPMRSLRASAQTQRKLQHLNKLNPFPWSVISVDQGNACLYWPGC
jgi:hypothetical protein